MAIMVLMATAAFAKGGAKGSAPQFNAPTPADYYVNECDGSMIIEWTPVVNNSTGAPPTKYAIQIVITSRDACPDGNVVGSTAYNFTSPGNTSEFTTPGGIVPLFVPPEICSGDDIVVLIKALNPPGKSQNNPQAIATLEGIGTVTCF
jgi:hypothetical protein